MKGSERIKAVAWMIENKERLLGVSDAVAANMATEAIGVRVPEHVVNLARNSLGMRPPRTKKKDAPKGVVANVRCIAKVLRGLFVELGQQPPTCLDAIIEGHHAKHVVSEPAAK